MRSPFRKTASLGWSEAQGSKDDRVKRGGAKDYPWNAYKPTAEHELFLAETGQDYAYGTGGHRGVSGQVNFRDKEFIKWAQSRDPKPGDPSGLAYTASTGKLSHPTYSAGRGSIFNRYKPTEASAYTAWNKEQEQIQADEQVGEDKYNDVLDERADEDDVVQDFLDGLPGGANDPNAPGAGGGTLDEIVNTDPPIAAPAPPIAAPAPGGTTVDNGGVVWDADGDGIYDGPVFIPEEGTLGEIIGSNPEEGINSNPEEGITSAPSPGYTIDINGNILDANGNIIGTSSEAPVTPGYTIEDNIIYDSDGNPIGTGNATEIGDVIGGASPSNPVFDELTQQQITDAAKAAEAVELMDSGYGRYNAAMRKLGIVGRQGESYAPLILDQLRMAEMEAAQPQFAAFGFGQNPMLGGMPQIGVQGVQGNVGGQSALSALSNAGLNQLQVAQQPYNRIALPETGLGGQPISQINNPTIFKASTSV